MPSARLLNCHPATPARGEISIDVEAAVSEYNQIVLRFELHGDLSKLVVPPPARYGERRDGLWQATCFEAFVRSVGDQYVEINLSPSTAWAAYVFDTYRGEPTLPEIDSPPLDIDRESDLLRLTAAVDLSGVEFLGGHDQWEVNLTAVIEETDGTKSYWALAHPSGKPDFHHPDGFVLELPASA